MSPTGMHTPEPPPVSMDAILAALAAEIDVLPEELLTGRTRRVACYIGWAAMVPPAQVGEALGLTESEVLGVVQDVRAEMHGRHYNDLGHLARKVLAAARKNGTTNPTETTP